MSFPSAAEEEMRDTLSLDEFLIENRDATYMIKVNSDSMIDAGILPGDMVLVERGLEPREGDIVLAEADGKWMLKYFRKKAGGKPWLESANSRYGPIIPERELQIAAIVKAVIRKY